MGYRPSFQEIALILIRAGGPGMALLALAKSVPISPPMGLKPLDFERAVFPGPTPIAATAFRNRKKSAAGQRPGRSGISPGCREIRYEMEISTVCPSGFSRSHQIVRANPAQAAPDTSEICRKHARWALSATSEGFRTGLRASLAP